MNSHKIEEELYHLHPHHHNDDVNHQPPPSIMTHHHHHHHDGDLHPSILNSHEDDLNQPFSFSSMPEIVLFPSSPASDAEDDSPDHSSDNLDDPQSQLTTNTTTVTAAPAVNRTTQNPQNPPAAYISPDSHISTQFYTFTADSHSLMIRCILESRLPTADEIRAATPRPVLKSWRSVWKDRNEATAYLTAWKRIQDKLGASRDENGNEFLFFKSNSQQFVSHIGLWYHIVTSFHGDADLKHLGLKDTIDRIKQHWTVGAKFYGIPESYIRVCVRACPVCTGASASGGGSSKRRRFEYTESFDVPAKEVQQRLLQLAAKHKVVLCIRQKYIRYKPFMAEVKDYACHRAGEPAAKKAKILKREPYASKRCGCGFRIRAIVPIANYNEKDKTFVYQDEGVAVFKLYAVHTGHEPGPLDGNARIMHRVLGHKGAIFMDQDVVYGVSEDLDNDSFPLTRIEEGEFQFAVLQQVQELKAEVGLLEGRIGKIPFDQLASVSRDLFDIVNKIRSIGEDSSKSMGLLSDKPHADDVLVGESDLAHWSDDPHHDRIFGDGKEPELIEDDEDSFGQTLDEVAHWDQMRTECRGQKDLLSDSSKTEKWLKCSEFDEKSILDCEEESKLTKPLRHDDAIVTDVGLVGIHVDSFYQENPKWYDSPCGLDSGTDCGDGGFRHGEIV